MSDFDLSVACYDERRYCCCVQRSDVIHNSPDVAFYRVGQNPACFKSFYHGTETRAMCQIVTICECDMLMHSAASVSVCVRVCVSVCVCVCLSVML